MNEEEKKVVGLLQHCQNTYIEDTLVTRLQLTTKEAKILLNLVEKQQKEIEKLKKESICDTKFDKLLFSIRMLHFHHYINDTQFEKMINKLSNEGE